MNFIADLHIHSRYAKATSPALGLDTLYQYARIKGVDVIGTGDFTHPKWFAELKERLQPIGNGFFKLKNPPTDLFDNIRLGETDPKFCLTTEISCETIFNGKQKRVHNLLYAPDFETVQKIISALGTEFDILHKLPIEDIKKKNPLLAIAVSRLRVREFESEPGYDGHYGTIRFFKGTELEKLKRPQISLF